jgi:hypothetical protein
MAIIGLLPEALGTYSRKLSSTQAAITGTGGITTGLTAIDTGGAVVSVANSATALPVDVATITSISGGTVNVAVVKMQSATNGIEGSAFNVNCIATGA